MYVCLSQKSPHTKNVSQSLMLCDMISFDEGKLMEFYKHRTFYILMGIRQPSLSSISLNVAHYLDILPKLRFLLYKIINLGYRHCHKSHCIKERKGKNGKHLCIR